MLRSLIASSESGDVILKWIEYAALAIEVLAVLVIVGAIFHGMARYAVQSTRGGRPDDRYRELKTHLGRALLLGLEILVAADIVRTVALDSTLQAITVLGLLVLIRTFLSWALVVEIEGRWPWQPGREEAVAVPPERDD
ncbi:DUF1622 domain-containing protein [Chloroflexota bacterium]